MADPGPRLYRPRAPLSKYIDYFGYWERDSGTTHRSRAMPRGALPFLGTALGDLENSCVGLSDIWGYDGTVLHERLIGAPTAALRVALLEDFLLTRARVAAPRHPGLTAVLDAVERRPSLRISQACELTGLSPRRLIALFRAEVGLSPKAYVRVRRFQAALRQLDAGTVRGAGIAADLGYFDQAHFVREFRTFAATTPTQYTQRRIALPSHVGLEPQKFPIPRQSMDA